MNEREAKAFLEAFRREQINRQKQLPEDDHEGEGRAYDQWIRKDLPFVNELCLMFLVALNHEVERQLSWLAARAGDKSISIEPEAFKAELGTITRNRGGRFWEEIDKRLPKRKDKDRINGVETVDLLRMLANATKHDAESRPSEELREKLGLSGIDSEDLNYATLAGNQFVIDGLAQHLGLSGDLDYIDISKVFVDRTFEYLRDVENGSDLRPIRWPDSNPFDSTPLTF